MAYLCHYLLWPPLGWGREPPPAGGRRCKIEKSYWFETPGRWAGRAVLLAKVAELKPLWPTSSADGDWAVASPMTVVFHIPRGDKRGVWQLPWPAAAKAVAPQKADPGLLDSPAGLAWVLGGFEIPSSAACIVADALREHSIWRSLHRSGYRRKPGDHFPASAGPWEILRHESGRFQPPRTAGWLLRRLPSLAASVKIQFTGLKEEVGEGELMPPAVLAAWKPLGDIATATVRLARHDQLLGLPLPQKW